MWKTHITIDRWKHIEQANIHYDRWILSQNDFGFRQSKKKENFFPEPPILPFLPGNSAAYFMRPPSNMWSVLTKTI